MTGGLEQQKTAYKYSSFNETWTVLRNMPQYRYSASSINVNGKCYVIGGQDSRDISVYDPKKDTFTTVYTMETRRMHFDCCKYSEHEILIVGGNIGEGALEASDSCIVFNTLNNTVTELPKLNQGRKLFALAESGGKFYAMGGANMREGPFRIMQSIEVFDKEKNKWEINSMQMSQQRFSHEAVSHNGFIYVFGGQNNTSDIHNYVEKYDMNNGTYTTLTARMNFRRGSEFGICKAGTKVYLVGGSYKRSRKSKDTYTNKVEVFSLVNENFQLLKDLPKADGFLSACILCDE